MAPKDNNQKDMDEAEAFIRMQMARNDEKLKNVRGVDCAGFEVVKDGMLLQHDTGRYLLGSARATRLAVDDISEKLDKTHDSVKLLVDEFRKSGGNGNGNGNGNSVDKHDGKAIASWKLPLIGEVFFRGFCATDIVLILLCVGLIVVGVKAWSSDTGSAVNDKNKTSEEAPHGEAESKPNV